MIERFTIRRSLEERDREHFIVTDHLLGTEWDATSMAGAQKVIRDRLEREANAGSEYTRRLESLKAEHRNSSKGAA